VLHILEQVCTSLGEAHGHGIVHRDMKPENVMLESREGEEYFVKVLDFGIAKIATGDQDPRTALTASGTTLGTLEYMSPEQLMGQQLDGRSDIYALGLLSYQILTGKLPYPSQAPVDIIGWHLKEIPEPPSRLRKDIPPAVDHVVLRMMAKRRDERFASVGELRIAVLAALNEIGGFAGSPSASAITPSAGKGGPHLTPAGAGAVTRPSGAKPLRGKPGGAPGMLLPMLAVIGIAIAAALVVAGVVLLIGR
jgi:serine/threonine-protein kinase